MFEPYGVEKFSTTSSELAGSDNWAYVISNPLQN